MIDNLVTIVVALRYPLMLIGGICIGIFAFRARLDSGRPIHGPAVMWPLPAVDAPDAEFEAWARQALDIGNGPAFEQTLAEIRELPEVAS